MLAPPSMEWRDISHFFRLLKGEGWLTEFSDGKAQIYSVRNHIFIWYFTKIGPFFIPTACALQINDGIMYWLPPAENVCIFGKGEWYETHVSRLVAICMEFLVVMFIKDGISMNIYHQLVHSKWYDHHKTHHLPERGVYCKFTLHRHSRFDSGKYHRTIFLCPLKFLFGAKPSLHYYTFLLSAVCDINIHNLSPYITVCFWNALLDNMMRCTLSHNLHHSNNIGHYTMWPLHQIPVMSGPKHKGKNSDGFDYDISREYNTNFGTKFPEDLWYHW